MAVLLGYVRSMLVLRVCSALVLVVLAAASATATAPKPRPPAEEGWRPPTEDVDYGEYPAKYEEIVKEWFAGNLKDPESVRYRRISRPRKEHAIENQFRHEALYGYSVCVEYNAKNSYGGYGGFQTQWFLIRNNAIARVHVASGPIYLGYYPNCEDGPELAAEPAR